MHGIKGLWHVGNQEKTIKSERSGKIEEKRACCSAALDALISPTIIHKIFKLSPILPI